MRNRCTVGGCLSFVMGHGFCSRHYQRWLHHGSPDVVKRLPKGPPTCTIEGCGRRYKGRGLCPMHLRRLRLYGDPLRAPGRAVIPPLDRLALRTDKRGPDECWGWLGYRTVSGYGLIGINGHAIPVHRFAYESFVGPIPHGFVVDHLCRNRACVNPAHLEAVTQGENNRRAWAASRHQITLAN